MRTSRLILVTMLATILGIGQLWAESSFTITFKTSGTTDSSTELTTTTFLNQVTGGAENIDAVASVAKCYEGAGGLKLSSNKADGSFSLTLKETLKITKVVLSVKNKNATTKSVTVGSTEFSTTDSWNTSSFSDMAFTGTETETNSVAVAIGGTANSARVAYLASMTIYYNDGGSGGGGSTDVPATAVALNESNLPLEQYREETLTATLTPSNATTAVVWTSSNESVATVSSGLVKAVSTGSATITATAGEGVSATCAVTVSQPTVLTCAQAAAYAATVSNNNVLYAGGQYVVEGYVITKGSTYIWLADDASASSGTFEIYKPSNSSEISDLAVGDKVRGIGYITKYNTTYEFAQGCTFSKVTTPPTPPAPTVTLSAGKTTIDAGESITFSWEAENTTVQTFKELVYKVSGALDSTKVNALTVQFDNAGSYEVRCYVTCDNSEVVMSNTVNITVNAVAASVTLSADKSTAFVNETVTFSYVTAHITSETLEGLYYRMAGDENFEKATILTHAFDEKGTWEVCVKLNADGDVITSNTLNITVKDIDDTPVTPVGDKTYTHAFSAADNSQLSASEWSLSNVTWSASNMKKVQDYVNGYAGIHLGSGSYNGSLTLTSKYAWGEETGNDYEGLTKITKITLWVNKSSAGSLSTCKVSIGGVEATSSGLSTVGTNTSANGDYTKTSPVVFTPAANGDKGVVLIELATSNAVYIACIQIECAAEDNTPATVTCLPSVTSTYTDLDVDFDFKLQNAVSGEFVCLRYWKTGDEAHKQLSSQPTLTFTEAGSYEVTITVAAKNKGNVTSDPVTITVTDRPAGVWLVLFKDFDGTVLSKQVVNNGNAAVAPANPSRSGYRFTGWSPAFNNVTSDLDVIAQYEAVGLNITTKKFTEVDLPSAAMFYDMNGNSKLQAVGYDDWNDKVIFLSDYSADFATEKTLSGTYYQPVYLDDANLDGIIDFGSYNLNNGTYTLQAVLSNGSDYTTFGSNALVVANMDVNGDGRPDLMGKMDATYLYWYEQLPTGEFKQHKENLYTYDGYQALRLATTANLKYVKGLIDAEVVSSTSTSSYTAYPTQAVDLNGDGFIDLIEDKYYDTYINFNMGNGNWIQAEYPADRLIPVDLNNDAMLDYLIVSNKDLKASIYRGNGEFESVDLCNTIVPDLDVYCRDFDHDGDVDILMTSSGVYKSSEPWISYSLILTNDGKGNFTKAGSTQSHGTDNYMTFSNLADIDGDGFYDLLAFNGTNNNGKYAAGENAVEVVVLRGKSDLTFGAPERLFQFDNYSTWQRWRTSMEASTPRINVADIDSDGKPEIWVSGVTMRIPGDGTKNYSLVARNAAAPLLAAPVAPAKPTLIYEKGLLTVIWGNGSDASTPAMDLTYALRIGTTSGGNDILHSHANASGARRNFLDGNMGKTHSFTIDLSSYPQSNIYVSVQTINDLHRGSAWSAEAVVAHDVVNAEFQLAYTSFANGEEVKATFAPMPNTYTRSWNLGDGVLKSMNEAAGEAVFTFANAGKKEITMTLTGPNGVTDKQAQTITVLPNAVTSSVVNPDYLLFRYRVQTGDYYPFNMELADYNFDGNWDAPYNKQVVNYNADMSAYTVATSPWNANLNCSYVKFFDWNMDGFMDLLYSVYGSTSETRYLPHNGTSDFQEDYVQDNTLVNLFNSKSTLFADFAHNGKPGYINNGSVYSYNGTAFTGTKISNDQNTMVTNITKEKRLIDFNHDGFMDIPGLYTTGTRYGWLYVLLNNGEGSFDIVQVPFDASQSTSYLVRWQLADMDADGFYDLVALSKDGTPFIMWNSNNESFSAPQKLSQGPEIKVRTFGGDGDVRYSVLVVADIDNDGYNDIISTATAVNDDKGYYVYYMGPNRTEKLQGFLTRNTGTNQYTQYTHMLYFGGKPHLYNGRSGNFEEVGGAANEKPSAPTNLRAMQTEKGLLIEWDAAADDHTPATMMRYNISVKKRGATGAGSFVISPQNGEKNGTVHTPDYAYIEGTRFFIPKQYLEAGKYNIKVQALDAWNAMGDFSAQLQATVETTLSLDAPTSVCVDDQAHFTYNGTVQTGTPTWDWDGGTAVGSGFGPYNVSWSTPGLKTVTLTANGDTYKRTIQVETVNTGLTLPAAVFDNTTLSLDVPAGFSVKWAVEDRPAGLYTNGNKVILIDVGSGTWNVTATLTNANGCTEEITGAVRVIGKEDMPQITIIAPDADNHHVINFAADPMIFPQVRIMKETNVKDKFLEVATVNTADGLSYTDPSTNAAQRADRYAVIGIAANGAETPMSSVHQTLHLTINRGIQDNTWNLIWNQYVGADVVTYNILRGSADNTLEQIASLSAYNTSYTDESPDAGKPYYAIEFVLNNPAPQAASARRVIRKSATLTGKSNIVNSLEARTVIYATGITVHSTTDAYALSSGTPQLQLYAELIPANATYKDVVWEVTAGADLMRIAEDGIATILSPNPGGTATVRATTMDGTSLSATCSITVSAISDSATGIELINDEQSDVVIEPEILDILPDATEQAVKIIHKGQLYILRNGKIYNAQGARVK